MYQFLSSNWPSSTKYFRLLRSLSVDWWICNVQYGYVLAPGIASHISTGACIRHSFHKQPLFYLNPIIHTNPTTYLLTQFEMRCWEEFTKDPSTCCQSVWTCHWTEVWSCRCLCLYGPVLVSVGIELLVRLLHAMQLGFIALQATNNNTILCSVNFFSKFLHFSCNRFEWKWKWFHLPTLEVNLCGNMH